MTLIFSWKHTSPSPAIHSSSYRTTPTGTSSLWRLASKPSQPFQYYNPTKYADIALYRILLVLIKIIVHFYPGNFLFLSFVCSILVTIFESVPVPILRPLIAVRSEYKLVRSGYKRTLDTAKRTFAFSKLDVC
jgi:hypothetical protein